MNDITHYIPEDDHEGDYPNVVPFWHDESGAGQAVDISRNELIVWGIPRKVWGFPMATSGSLDSAA